jgi:hypothetical protein
VVADQVQVEVVVVDQHHDGIGAGHLVGGELDDLGPPGRVAAGRVDMGVGYRDVGFELGQELDDPGNSRELSALTRRRIT